MYVYKVWAYTDGTSDYWRFIRLENPITEKQEHEIREKFCQELIKEYDCTIEWEGLTLYTIE